MEKNYQMSLLVFQNDYLAQAIIHNCFKTLDMFQWKDNNSVRS